MVRTTLLISAALIATGVGFYFGTERESVTALIPAFVGIVLGGLALLARAKPNLRMHIMHVAVLLVVLCIAMTARGVLNLLTGTRDAPSYGRAVTCVLLVILLVFQVRSFIEARKARKASE